MKILFIHGHLIVDEYTEFIDGAIYIEDNKIIKVYPHTNKIKDEYKDIKIIDLKSNICRPAYFDIHFNNNSDGVSSYLYNLIEDEINIDNRCLGYFIDNIDNYYLCEKYLDNVKGILLDLKRDNKEILELIKDKNIKILLGKSEIDYDEINIDYDGIRNIFYEMKNLGIEKATLANAAFIDDKYVEFNVDMHISILKLLIKNIPATKLILISNHKNIHESVKYLRSLKIKHCDLLAYSALNAYRLFDLDNLYGSMHKGKQADLLILDNEYNILFKYINGELIYE